MIHNKSISLPPEIEKEYRFGGLLSLHENAIVFSMERKKASAGISNTRSSHPTCAVLKIIPQVYFNNSLYEQLQALHHPLLLLPDALYVHKDYVYAIYPKLLPLSEYLCSKELCFQHILQWIRDIDSSVTALHQKHIFHGDIAPGNIYLDRENHFYLGDFSSSAILPSQEKHKTLFQKGGMASTFPLPGRTNGFQQDIFSFLTIFRKLLDAITLPAEEGSAAIASLKNTTEQLLSEATAEKDTPSSFHQICCEILHAIEKSPLEHLLSGCSFTLSPQKMDFLEESTVRIKRRKLLSFFPPVCKIPLPLLGLAFCMVLFLSAFIFYATNRDSRELPLPPATETAARQNPVLDISHNRYREIPADIEPDSSVKIIFAEDNQITSLSSLSHFTSLEELYLDENFIHEIGEISALPSLSILGLSNNDIRDVSALGALTSLKILDLSCQKSLENLSSLAELKKLEYLVLTDTNAAERDIEHLQQALPSCTIIH